MKISILMIGSLYWDEATEREEWRHARLDGTNPLHVRAPIRYGRRSSSRGHSYTMVFSAGMEKERFGQAIVLPCKHPATTVDDLLEEAKHLWAAESNGERTARIYKSWGCVALLPNLKRKLPEGLVAGWKSYVSGKRDYPQLKSAKAERKAVSASGILKICWPQLPDGTDLKFDALLATATNPTIKNDCYPSARAIAKAWTTGQGNRYISYFDNNVSSGITTWQDQEIKCWLDQLGHTQ